MNIFIKNRVFRNLVVIDLLSSIGDIMFYLALINYASSFSDSSWLIMLITVAETIPSIFSIILGVLSDSTIFKIRAETMTFFIRSALYIIVSTILSQNKSLFIVYAVIILNLISDSLGIYADGLRFPVFKSILPSDDSLQERAFGFSAALSEIVDIISKLSGGFLIFALAYNYSMFAFLNALTFFVGGLLIWNLKARLPKLKFEVPINSIFKYKNFLDLWNSISIKKDIIYVAVINAFISSLPTMALINASTESIFKQPFSLISTIIISLETIGMLFGSFLSGKVFNKIHFTKLYISTFMIIVFFNIMASFSFIFFLFGILVSNFMLGLIFPKFEVKVINESETNNGTIIGLTNTLITISVPVMMGIVGFIQNKFGFAIACFMLVSLSFLIIIILTINRRRV